MAKCGNCGPTCACSLTTEHDFDGSNMSRVTGTGTAQDPFNISTVLSNDPYPSGTGQFITNYDGVGSPDDPIRLFTIYDPSATLDGLPDVDTTGKTNNQVLAWDSGTAMWKVITAPTAAPGAVTVDNSLTGDGSGGSPLQVRENAARLLSTVAAGLGITDAGVNRMVAHYANLTALNDVGSQDPAPVFGVLATVAGYPGVLWMYNGTTYVTVNSGSVVLVPTTSAFAELSGPYPSAGYPTKQWSKAITGSTDVSGDIDLMTAAELTGYAGILRFNCQETGTSPFKMMVRWTGTKVVGRAFSIATGTALGSTAVTAEVDSLLY